MDKIIINIYSSTLCLLLVIIECHSQTVLTQHSIWLVNGGSQLVDCCCQVIQPLCNIFYIGAGCRTGLVHSLSLTDKSLQFIEHLLRHIVVACSLSYHILCCIDSIQQCHPCRVGIVDDQRV